MRKIDLTAMAEKGYSLTEVVNSFKAGSDVRYALENKLFRVEKEKDFAPDASLVSFLDGKEGRYAGVFDKYGFVPGCRLLAVGDVVYRDRKSMALYTPEGYQRYFVANSHMREYSSNLILATIVGIRHLSLSNKDRDFVRGLMEKSARYGGRYSSLHNLVLEHKAQQRKAQKEAAAQAKAQAKKAAREQKDWEIVMAKDDKIRQRRGDGRFRSVMLNYRLYENLGGFTVAPNAEENKLNVSYENERYSKSCIWTKHVYSYKLHLKKGWHFVGVGGLLTLYRGKFNRLGMPCTWFEQKGWNYTQVRGYLVRGEHIIAKSLNEAIAINQEHRRTMLRDALYKLQRTREMRLRAQREKEEYAKEVAARKANAEAYMDNVITFEDSLASGNCRPGTQQFKDNVENALGKEVDQLTVRDIIPLAIRFHQESYVQRIFNHKGWKVEVNDYR